MSTTSPTSPNRGRGARHALIAVVLALATLLVPLSTPTAHAAPPEVTASENPVVIDIKTKQITLTWSLTAFTPLASLTVIESGTPEPVIDQPVTCLPCFGDVPLTVTLGKTYTAQLKDVFDQPLGAPLTITTKKADTSTPVDPCTLHQCITSVNVEPHGGWAQFTIKTNRNALMTLEASTAPPNADGTWSNPDAVAAYAGSILPNQNWTPVLKDLAPNTTYHYVVRAAGNGPDQVKTGSFKTLTRRVDVTFAKIEMIDDSDGFGAGDCDCFFWFSAGDSPDTQWGDVNAPKNIASGTSVHPNVTVTATNAPNDIPLRVSGNDDDTDFGEFCPAGIGPRYEGTGNIEECLEWAGRTIDVSVFRRGPDDNEEFTESFTISVSGELVYKVKGTYKVTYVP